MTARALAIVDWGIGGMGFYRRFRARRPEVPVVYWSDTGVEPYGRQGAERLAERLRQVLRRLPAFGVSHVVVACNAASTVLERVEQYSGCSTGVIEHGVAAALATGVERVGVVGGRRTILSGAYRAPLTRMGRKVTQRIAQPLSAFVEAGELDSPALRAELGRIVRPLQHVDALVLGCTHYPALLQRFMVALPGVTMVDPVERLLEHVDHAFQLPGGGRPELFLTTGDPVAMRAAALRAFGVSLGEIRRVVP